jgi:hypothetical protein
VVASCGRARFRNPPVLCPDCYPDRIGTRPKGLTPDLMSVIVAQPVLLDVEPDPAPWAGVDALVLTPDGERALARADRRFGREAGSLLPVADLERRVGRPAGSAHK